MQETFSEFKQFIIGIMDDHLTLQHLKTTDQEDYMEMDIDISNYFEKLIKDGRMSDCILLAKMLLSVNILPGWNTLYITRNNMDLCKFYAELPTPFTIDVRALYETMDTDKYDNKVVMYLCEKFPEKYLKNLDPHLQAFVLDHTNNVELYYFLYAGFMGTTMK